MSLKRLGCVAGVLGVLAIGGGCTLFGVAVVRAIQAHAVVEHALTFAHQREVEVTVASDRRCQIAVRVTVEVPRSAVRGHSGGGFTAAYDFPFRYTVADASEGELVSETTAVAANRGNRTVTRDTVGAEGGTFVAEHGFAKFIPPADGRLRVRCTLSPDSSGVVGRDPRLIIYDHVSDHGRTVGGGFLLVIAGGLATVVGLVLFLVGHAADRRRP